MISSPASGDAGRRYAGRRYALLIGIDTYPRLEPDAELRGAVNDAEGLADILEQRFGFHHRDLRLLVNEAAESADILRALDDLVMECRPGDVVVVHFSGHGSQVWDAEGDEPDGLDETWVPYDGHRDGSSPRLDITDDELFKRTAELRARGALLTLNMDCCHSGHAHRVAAARRISPDLRPVAGPAVLSPRAPGTVARGAAAYRVGSQVTFAACRDDQLAFETVVVAGNDPSRRHGAWTWSLLQTLKGLTALSTAREVFAQAARRLTTADPRQWPQIVGDRDRLIFGTELMRPKRHLLVIGQRSAEELDLSCGEVGGLKRGSRWGIYPSTVRDPVGISPVAEALITRVDSLTSRASLVSGHLPSTSEPSDWRAFELEPAVGERRLKVAFRNGGEQLRAAVAASPVLVWAEDDDYDVRISETRNLEDEKGRALGGASETRSEDATIRRLEKRARFLHGLRLRQESPYSRLRDCLDLRFLPDRHASSTEPISESGNQVIPHFYEGDSLRIEIEQRSDRGLYVYLLDFGLNDDVSLIYPEEGGADLLEPDQPFRLGVLESDRMELFFPDGFHSAEGMGFLKVFLTTRPTDFSWICTAHPWPRLSRRSQTLEALLSMESCDQPLRRDEDWTAEVFPFELRRRPIGINRGESSDVR